MAALAPLISASTLATAAQKWGNFISASGLNSGRFLDPPEFAVFHDKGNEENLFDRVDFQLSKVDSVHVNLGFTRSWFQTPNSFDNLNIGVTDPVVGNPVAPTDQRSQIKTFNIAPSWTRVAQSQCGVHLGAFVRRDQYNYYPSDNPFSDLGPIQQETVTQNRTLANTGLRSDISYVKGIHNLKAGATYQQTFLDEDTRFGIVDPVAQRSLLRRQRKRGSVGRQPRTRTIPPIADRPPRRTRFSIRRRLLRMPTSSTRWAAST